MLARTVVVAAATFLLATPALAAVDLTVSIDQPEPAYAYEYSAYHVTVTNLVNEKALDVELYIQLPETDTPQVELLGDLIDIDYRCTLYGTVLECPLGIVPLGSTDVTFQLALPWSSQALDIVATASTTSAEVTLANNTASHAGARLYYEVEVQPGQHSSDACLPVWPHGYVSYFECPIASGSAWTDPFEFDASGSVWLTSAPGVLGSWWQPAPERLVYTYDRGSAIHGVEQFEGWGVSPSCFEGMSSYSVSGVVHPRRICF